MMCDVLVVGAGPSGLATAIACAEQGLDVRILDRSTFPRPSVGEAVHPYAEALFERLGVADRVRKANFVRHTGIWAERRNKREFFPFGKTSGITWRGFQLWRPTFDQILLDRAKELGCQFVAPAIPSAPVRNAHGVRIATSASVFQPKIVVDGTGRSRWLARCWRLPIRVFSPRLVARYEYAEGNSSNIGRNPVFSQSEDGWDWTARVRENLYQWIRLRTARNKEGFAKPPSGFAGLHRVGRSHGADVTWTLVERPASLQHFLVGDAAAVLDPSSSHGMLRALSSGILAANCIAKIIRHGKNEAAVAGYAAWQRNWFWRDIGLMKSFLHESLVVSSLGIFDDGPHT